MPEKKSLKELCEMRDSIKTILEHKEWLGDIGILETALETIEYHIKHYDEYQKCEHRWIREVSDSAHYEKCAYCGKIKEE